MEEPQEDGVKSFGKRIFEFTLGTGISRITGLGREILMAYLFGVSKFTDSFLVAFTIPNLLRDLFAESALSASFVPILTKKKLQERRIFAYRIFHLLLLTTGLLVVMGILLSPWIVKIIAYGFTKDPERLKLTVSLTRWMFPFLLFVSLSAWAMGIINSHHRFFIPSVASTGFNLGTIVITLLTYTYFYTHGPSPIHSMALGVLLGGALQFMIQIPTLMGLKYRYLPASFWHQDVKRAIKLWIPVTFGFAFTRINVAVDTFLITFLGPGSVSYIKYAYRIMHLPLGLFGIAVGAVSLPALSEVHNVKEELYKRLEKTVSYSLLLSIPSGLLLAGGSLTFVDLLFRYGKFSYSASINTAWALSLYSLGIPAFSMIKSLNSLYYALENTKTPTLFSGVGVMMNIVLNISLMQIMGFKAFPLATSISNTSVVLLSVWHLKKYYKIPPSLYIKDLPHIFISSLLSSIPVYFISLWQSGNIVIRVLKSFLSILIFLLIFLLILYIFSKHYRKYINLILQVHR